MPKKLTREEFIRRSNVVYGDKYDYSLVVYINSKTNVIIICPIHGKFEQTPETHMNGSECKECGKIKSYNKRKKSQEDFEIEANKIHNSKYIYTKSKYISYHKDITIICPIHGKFEQTPANHLSGKGCNECGIINSSIKRIKTTENFILESIRIHGDRYDYNKVIYINATTNVIIICSIHGEFEQTPSNHLSGCGCQECGIKKTAQQKRYDKDIFTIKGKLKHGENEYDYSEVEYINHITDVWITHKSCGYKFQQKPTNHLQGQGCPICNISKLEQDILLFLKKNNICYKHQHTFDWLKNKNNLYLDFYLPHYNIGIECQGEQHFKTVDFFGGVDGFLKTQERDKLKEELCKNNNIKILYYTNCKSNIIPQKYLSKIFTIKEELLNEIQKK